MSTRAAVVLPAAGSGRRFGGVFKPFAPLAGEPMLSRALRPFLGDARIRAVIVALPAEFAAQPPAWLHALDSRIRVVPGGEDRGASVFAGLQAVADDIDVVLVHDAARPLVTRDIVDRAIAAAAGGENVVTAVPATDTVQRVDTAGRIVDTPDRTSLWLAQTPQAFPRAVVVNAYAQAAAAGIRATDDAAIVRATGATVRVLRGDPTNIKVTVPEDLPLAEALLGLRPDRS